MIEMKVFDDVNKLCPIESMSLHSNTPPGPHSPVDRAGWSKIKRFFRFKRQVHVLAMLLCPSDYNHEL